jgi:hypothetical protein
VELEPICRLGVKTMVTGGVGVGEQTTDCSVRAMDGVKAE